MSKPMPHQVHCPFCGVIALWPVKADDGEEATYWMECALCHARGPSVELSCMALLAWNRRPGPIKESVETENLTAVLTATKTENAENVVPEAGIEPATKGL